MDIKIANNDPQSMAQDGDAILRSLQNIQLPVIDLIVREALQNSLDATLPNAENTDVAFKYTKFETSKLAPHLKEISQVLQENFPGENDVLIMSDKNTSGLTGEYATTDINKLNESNFHKLVFSIGKNQEKEDAGGSWGLGKTSYFRSGIGIILYYTRIKQDKVYEERLIGSLIESPKNEKRVLPKSDRGIAWWGDFDLGTKTIHPITDADKIKEILSIFSLENYTNHETGTSIIIPYFDPMRGIEETDRTIFPWEYDVIDHLKIAIQRWYFPRLYNDIYHSQIGNSKLTCTVNGEPVCPVFNGEPTFNIFIALYNAALSGQTDQDNIYIQETKPQRNVFDNNDERSGRIAFCEVSREMMDMTPPNNRISGLAYIGVDDEKIIEQNTSKVIAYTRKPGMIVEYAVDSDWSPKGLIQTDDNLLFGVFVPNSSAKLKPRFVKRGLNDLESYLRATENADHAKWEDEDGVRIIRRIKEETTSAINNVFKKEEEIELGSATSALSRTIGAIFMPPRNFGKSSVYKNRPSKTTQTDPNTIRNKQATLNVIGTNIISNQEIEINFVLNAKPKYRHDIYLQVQTLDQRLNFTKWHESVGTTKFPFMISKLVINKVNNDVLDIDIKSFKHSNIVFNKKEKLTDSFIIESFEEEFSVIMGKITLMISSNEYVPYLALKSILSEESE